MAMILITYREKNRRTGRMETRVSHGVCLNSGRDIITDNETIDTYIAHGAKMNQDIGEYVMA